MTTAVHPVTRAPSLALTVMFAGNPAFLGDGTLTWVALFVHIVIAVAAARVFELRRR